MKRKNTILAAAIAATLAAGLSGHAAASIYARSYLKIDNLSILISADGGATPGGAAIRSFNFGITNSADLNGNLVSDSAACSGVPGTPSASTNNCNPRTNTGEPTPNTRLDALAVNGGGSVPTRTNNDFTFFGAGNGEYSNADGVIYSAQLTGDASTSVEQIVESELQDGFSAQSSSVIKSTTGLTFTFTVQDDNSFIRISFDALAGIMAQVDADCIDPKNCTFLADANAARSVEFRLTDDTITSIGDANVVFQWRPNGEAATGTGIGLGAVKVQELDPFDLQADYQVSTLPCSNDGNPDPGDCASLGFTGTNNGFYLLEVSNLKAGQYTLGLTSDMSTILSQSKTSIPEPATLALLGMGLAGMGFASRRRKQA